MVSIDRFLVLAGRFVDLDEVLLVLVEGFQVLAEVLLELVKGSLGLGGVLLVLVMPKANSHLALAVGNVVVPTRLMAEVLLVIDKVLTVPMRTVGPVEAPLGPVGPIWVSHLALARNMGVPGRPVEEARLVLDEGG